jgi:uncharacterized membrane protein YcaP (DUF421 family)
MNRKDGHINVTKLLELRLALDHLSVVLRNLTDEDVAPMEPDGNLTDLIQALDELEGSAQLFSRMIDNVLH